MGLTNALYTGLSGLTTTAQLINVSGNNIANVNTHGFKSSRVSFETQISQQLSSGSAPNASSGGTNPTQVGLGSHLGTISRDFNTGSVQPTGVNTDLAIEGNGFFTLDFDGQLRYGRAGNFLLDNNFDMINQGGRLQGFGVDGNFNVVEGVLQTINVPIGVLTVAEATSEVKIGGNLNAGGVVGTLGSVSGTNELHSIAGSAAGANQAVAGISLNSLFATGSATPLYVQGTAVTAGDVISVSGVTKGGGLLPTHTFEVNATNVSGSDDFGTTVQDFMDFLTDILGIDTSIGGAEGVAITAGQIVITGNTGVKNDLEINSSNIIKNPATAPVQSFTMTKSQNANGESVRTTYLIFDSLGNTMNVDMSLVLEAKTATGTDWRFFIQSEDDSNLSRVLTNGTLSFGTNGQLLTASNASFTINRLGTGAASPQIVNLAFGGAQGTISALTDTNSQVTSLNQNGTPIGTLQDFFVSNDGTITGQFSNSLPRTLGRIILSTFTNPQGLIEEGKNLYKQSNNSGTAQVYAPGTGGAGKLIGGALELSNVELSQEFINLITASTGFSASSRVLTTSEQLIQDLINTIR